MQPYEGPAALHLRAHQVEFQVAVPISLARVAYRLPGAFVPDDDLAGAVLALRNLAFELVVGDGVVFHLDGHALDGRIVAGPFGHRPAFHGAVQLQPEIVVQPGGPVLLDHEGPRGGAGLAAGGRFRRDVEVALLPVLRKRVGHGRRRLARPAAGFAAGLRTGFRLGGRFTGALFFPPPAFSAAAVLLPPCRPFRLRCSSSVRSMTLFEAMFGASSCGSITVSVLPAFTFCSTSAMMACRNSSLKSSGFAIAGHVIHQHPGHLHVPAGWRPGLVDAHGGQVQVVHGLHLIAPAHQVQHQRIPRGHQRGQMLLGLDHHLGDAHLAGLGQRIAQQRIDLRGPC